MPVQPTDGSGPFAVMLLPKKKIRLGFRVMGQLTAKRVPVWPKKLCTHRHTNATRSVQLEILTTASIENRFGSCYIHRPFAPVCCGRELGRGRRAAGYGWGGSLLGWQLNCHPSEAQVPPQPYRQPPSPPAPLPKGEGSPCHRPSPKGKGEARLGWRLNCRPNDAELMPTSASAKRTPANRLGP